MKVRHVYCDRGDHISYRCLSEYQYDPRDVMPDGTPHPSLLRSDQVSLEEGEIEFDHEPSEAELKTAFPVFFARQPVG